MHLLLIACGRFRRAQNDPNLPCQYFSAFFNAASIVASGNIEDKQQAIERIGEMVYQQRTGHFRLNCRVFDGNRAIGVGVIEIEVLFKGRFSDVGCLPLLLRRDEIAGAKAISYPIQKQE